MSIRFQKEKFIELIINVDELIVSINFYEDVKEISNFMKKDFKMLIGEDVTININKGYFNF
ncbi:hypothetical protein [Clostridium senegalense]|uniref:hypothetical protein n=1 Tax=Clostridium senegalense TaxID=1465809 RepID=UPI000288F635|nr:hypothetical protein [Clostridium senegalense]